jgi:hypothetical protein
MKEFIFENKNKELTFDYDENTRTKLSREEHEVIIEPINLKDVLCNNKIGIPLIKLVYHEVRIIVNFGSLDDCIEPIGDNPPPIINQNQYMLEGDIIGLYTSYDTEERRRIALSRAHYITKHNNTLSGIISKQHRFIGINVERICSAAYIHITDMNGNEIPRQVLNSIRLNINNCISKFSGFQSRHQMRNNLPHITKPNNESKNLYYISYWPGRTNQRGAEQGLNLSHIDSYRFEIEFENWVPDDIQYKIHINHRSQNILRMMSGMAGLQFEYGNNRIIGIQDHPIETLPRALASLTFPNTDQLIQVSADDVCMISEKPFKNGELVDQCNQCKKVFTTAMLQQRLSTRNPDEHKCIHCSKEYNTNTFIRGKAHIVARLNFKIAIKYCRPLGFLERLFGRND